MNMHWVDWSIVGGLLVVLVYAAYGTKKYTRSVADFLAANRCGGRYVLGVAEGIAQYGAITVVMYFEAYYNSGFSFHWWGLLLLLAQIAVSLTGWVQYRFRQTRALTMAQFLEMRYSKNFRVFAGITAFVSGTLNFGIFPAVGARFFMHFCGLPSHNIPVAGNLTIDLTYAIIMIILLAIALFFACIGGQIAVMVTNFIQGTVFNALFCIVAAFIIIKVPWSDVLETLMQQPEGKSMFNPMDTANTEIFNKWFYMISAFGTVWCWMAWQGQQAYYCSGRNPHEARMGRVLGHWRALTQEMLLLILPIFAIVLLKNANWTGVSEQVKGVLDGIGNETIQTQVRTTITLTKILPMGLMGGFAAVMMAAFISTHDTYLHSWGSILIQDVILPFRKKPLDSRQHLGMLRWSIISVAGIIFIFSLVFVQYDFIMMFFALTGLLWLGGAGTCIVGGLYWKKGTTTGAYAALITGIVVFIIGFTMQKVWPHFHEGARFPIDSQWMWFIAMMISIGLYGVLSLLSGEKDFDMDKLLHRGQYAIAEDQVEEGGEATHGWQAIFGMGKDFNLRDKIVFMIMTAWTIVWAVIFLVVTAYNFIFKVPEEIWSKFWHFYIWMTIVIGIITTVWFAIGGVIDLKKMFYRLKTMSRNEQDDGTVVHNNGQNE